MGMMVHIAECEQLSLLFRLLILRFSLTLLATLVVLNVLIIDCECLINLSLKGRIVLDPVASQYFLCGKYQSKTYRLTNSGFSISNNIPVILPANSGCITWILGNRASPRSCFCWAGPT